MESPRTPEQREAEIDRLIKDFAEREKGEGFGLDEIMIDIATFAPTQADNPEYLKQIAEMIRISPEEMERYAIKKAKDIFEE